MSTRTFELPQKSFDLLLQAEKVRELNRSTPSAVAGHLVTWGIYLWMVWESVSQSSILSLTLFFGIVLFARLAISRAFKKFPNKLSIGNWLTLIRLGTLATSLSWGAQSVLLLPSSQVQQIMLVAVIIGINGAALAGLACDRWSLLMFSTVSSFSLMADFFMSYTQVGTTVGFLMFVFWVYVIAAAFRGEHAFRNAVTLREQVKSQNYELHQAQEISHIGSFNWHLQSGKFDWSDEHFKLWGIKPKSVTPDYALFLARIHPDDVGKVEAAVQHALHEGNLYDCEHRVVWPNGCERFIYGRGKAVFNADGQATNLIATSQDVTEKKLAERSLERTAQLQLSNNAKDAFLATMSHEIRTPLAGLLGMMELLNLSSLNPEQRQQLETAQLSGKGLLRIVNDILDWSKIEAGKLDLAPQQAAISEMLNGVVNTYAQLAADKGITLKLTVDPKLNKEYVFDPLRLSQILNNFTSNAIKFTEQGSVEIGVQRLGISDSYHTVQFSVRDSGAGIGTEQQSRLFQYYEQATSDTARMYGGTGLGLAICRRLAELMDGTLSVESTLGMGSTFFFTINLTVAGVATPVKALISSPQSESIAQQAERAEGPLTLDGRALNVLIVDDHPVNRMLLKQQLGTLGVKVETAESGTPALNLYRNKQFDLIVTDCHMPEMDGYELTRHIRILEEQSETKSHIPIIAWTANVLSDEVERCQVAGMDDMLTKPTELADLRAMLLKWMNRK